MKTQLAQLARLSGLDNTERHLVSEFLTKPHLSKRDAACIQAMIDRHLDSRYHAQSILQRPKRPAQPSQNLVGTRARAMLTNP